MHQALPVDAQAPSSPLFGVGENRGAVGDFAQAPYTLDPETKALFADLLTSQGLADEYVFPALENESAPVVPVERAPVATSVPYPSATFNTATSYGGDHFSNPQDRALSFDAQLASPLFEPDYSPYLGNGFDLDDPAMSAQCSPLWSDVGAVSPAAFCSSAGPSPSMGTVELFSSFGLGSSTGYTADGASSTSTSRAAANAVELFSPVVHPVADTGALGLDQISPEFLPAALPVSDPAVVPSTATSSSFSSPALAPEPTFAADSIVIKSESSSPEEDPLDAADDEEWLPGAAFPRATSVGPVRSSRRTTTATTRSKKASSSSSSRSVKPPLPGLKVALDAPITQRTYSAPNARTAKKAIPLNLQKRMDAARARGEDVDEEAWVAEADRKRQANTMSARQSRAKKAERVLELEETERRYVEEKQEWATERRRLVRRIEELEEIVGGCGGEAKKRRRVA